MDEEVDANGGSRESNARELESAMVRNDFDAAERLLHAKADICIEVASYHIRRDPRDSMHHAARLICRNNVLIHLCVCV